MTAPEGDRPAANHDEFVLALRHVAAAAQEVLDEARTEAATMRTGARQFADDLVRSARAEAEAAAREERERAKRATADLLAQRRLLAAERRSLAELHTLVAERAKSLIGELEAFSAPGVALLAKDAGFSAGVLDSPDAEAVAAALTPPPAPASSAIELSPGEEAQLEQAFDEFFSEDVDHEPSRVWILES